MKKLPIIGKPTAAAAQRELSAKPVGGKASRPDFPTRDQAYRAAGILGGASLLVAGLAGPALAAPTASPQQAQVAMSSESGSIDGQGIAATRPKFKVWREGGGIGPAEDMWVPKDVEAFINWTMAREGALAIQTNYRIDGGGGAAIKLDGFDPARNIGYVYSDQQSMPLGDAERAKLDGMVKDGKLAVLYLDLKRAPDAATLQGKVIKFLAASAKAPPSSAKLPVAPPPAAKGKRK
jgi:hypothetical protein